MAMVNATAPLLHREDVILWEICVVMIMLWLLGMATPPTMGGLIHILLVTAIIVGLVCIIQEQKIL
jgi:hypothetical protein